MSKLRSHYALPVLLLLAGALPGCATFGKCEPGECSNDAKITTNVQTSLDKRPELGPPHSIAVQTRGGVVFLDGQVDEGLERETAESLASQVPGVARVVDSIYVSR
jgi:osmotically-inducible protein OsmY